MMSVLYLCGIIICGDDVIYTKLSCKSIYFDVLYDHHMHVYILSICAFYTLHVSHVKSDCRMKHHNIIL